MVTERHRHSPSGGGGDCGVTTVGGGTAISGGGTPYTRLRNAVSAQFNPC